MLFSANTGFHSLFSFHRSEHVLPNLYEPDSFCSPVSCIAFGLSYSGFWSLSGNGGRLRFISSFLEIEAATETDSLFQNQSATNSGKTVITISREYGSDGRKIGIALSERLGFSYYDKKIIAMTAESCNLPASEVEANEEKMQSPLLNDLLSFYNNPEEDTTLLDKLYRTETEMIRNVATKGNCIIIGRSADYILKDFNNCVNIFIFASDAYKIANIMKRENLSRLAAQKHMQTINKRRFIHYKYYTGKIFGLSKNYHLCLDISKLGFDNTLAIIQDYLALNDQSKIKLSA
jgi:cytidylate kinase